MSVGVVITCHNEAAWVYDALRSVYAQTRPVGAAVVVDDGSTDNSRALLRACAGAAPGLRVMRVTQRGMAAARNAGLMALSGCEWVIHLDGDDYLEPNFVEATLATLHAELDYTAAAYDAVVTRVKRSDGREWMPEPATIESMLERCTLSSCALYRRAALVAIGGFRADLGGDCDWGAWVELLARGARIAYCPDTAFHYRIRPGSLTSVETAADRARHHAIIRGLA